jgi:hypothetical protein
VVYHGKRGARVRRARRDRNLSLCFFFASIALAFVGVMWATCAGLVALWFFASWIADSDRFAKTTNRKLWTLRISIVFVGCLIAAWPVYRQWKIEQAEALEGNLFEGSFHPETNCMALPVQVGSAGATFYMFPPKNGKEMPPYFRPFPDAEFRVECGKRGALISTTVRDHNGNEIVSIERNHWHIFPPFRDKNYTNSALEVEDNSGHVVFQIRFAAGDPKKNLFPRIQLQGEWWSDEGHGLRIVFTGEAGGEMTFLTPQNQRNDALIKPIFKYPSRDFLGVLSD